MTLGSIAIDVGWLISLDTAGYDEHVAGVEFLHQLVRDRTPLLLDYDGHIIREYERNLTPASEGRRFFEQCHKEGIVEYLSPRPSKSCNEALSKAGFDPSDIPYIGVAERGSGLFLAVEEKHLADKMRKQVVAGCKVRIVTLSEINQTDDSD